MISFGKVARKITAAFTVLTIVLCRSARAQTFNCYEGQGVLENAWQDWSWSTNDFANTSYIYEGKSSVMVTYSGGYQGFELVSTLTFPAGYFTALTFTINGGPTAGRAIQVSFQVNGNQTSAINLNKFIRGGSVASKAWRTVSVPLSAFGIKPTDMIGNFLLQESSGHAQSPFWIGSIGWSPNIQSKPVKVAINATASSRTVDQKLFGVNVAGWDSGFTSSSNKTLLSQSGFKAYRFPGGSMSDTYDWSTNTSSGNVTWAVDFDQFASVAVPNTGGECFITANYGTGTPAQAAAWVNYSNIVKAYGFKYWEIGNEVYGSWETDSHARVNDPAIYATQFAQYYRQMKAVDPTIKIGAVATPGEDAYANYSDEAVTNPRTGQQHSGWTPVMLSTLAGLGVTPDFIIYHRYPEYVNDCDFTLLVCNSGWLADMADLRQQLKDYLGSANTATQIMCTENNCDAGTEGKQMCSIVNGVFMADAFAAVLQTECTSFLWWDWINGQNTSGDNGSWLYGWRMYGDEGVISPDFTQTYPVFYIEQLLNIFAGAGDEVLPTTSSYGLLTASTTKRADGTIRLLVVNKHPTQELATQLSFKGFSPVGPVTLHQYGIAQDNLAKNGKPQTIAVTTIKSWPLTTTWSFPPYSVSVLEFTNHK